MLRSSNKQYRCLTSWGKGEVGGPRKSIVWSYVLASTEPIQTADIFSTILQQAACCTITHQHDASLVGWCSYVSTSWQLQGIAEKRLRRIMFLFLRGTIRWSRNFKEALLLSVKRLLTLQSSVLYAMYKHRSCFQIVCFVTTVKMSAWAERS